MYLENKLGEKTTLLPLNIILEVNSGIQDEIRGLC